MFFQIRLFNKKFKSKASKKEAFVILLTLFLINNVWATKCPEKSNAPLCPDSGSTLLDDTYPSQAYVISNSPVYPSSQASKVTSSFIASLAKSYNYEHTPQIIIPVLTDQEFEEIKNQVKSKLIEDKVNNEKIDIVMQQMTHVRTQSYTWQQDYFESFVNPQTGNPVIREFASYVKFKPETRQAAKKISDAAGQCQVSAGEQLPTFHEYFTHGGEDSSFGSGEMGGNVEGAPGGFCLTGDNQSLKLAEKYCGNKDNVIQLQTSWLNVGHVDEIFKILPNHIEDGRPKQCQFSIMAASPKKALDLMKQSGSKNNPFFSFSPKLSPAELNEAKTSRTSNIVGAGRGNKIICRIIEDAYKNGLFKSPTKDQPSSNSKSVFIKIFIDSSYAGLRLTSAGEEFKCSDYIDQATNDIIRNGIEKDQMLLNLNLAIQDSIDNDKKIIKAKILERLPECAKYYDEMDAPNLFYGASPIEKDGHFTLPKDKIAGGVIDSFLPNPTNSVVMNKSVLLSESGNPTFDTFTEQEINKRKLDVKKIDTWDYAHVGNGNIHCSSHSIPFCKPR